MDRDGRGADIDCEVLLPIPTPILVVVAGNSGMVAGWPLVVPSRNPLVVLPIRHDRDTLSHIRRERAFSINVVPRDLGQRAIEIFGVKAADKLRRWGNVAPCVKVGCKYLGDSTAHVECMYDGEWAVEDHALVKCRPAHWECRGGEYAGLALCGDSP